MNLTLEGGLILVLLAHEADFNRKTHVEVDFQQILFSILLIGIRLFFISWMISSGR